MKEASIHVDLDRVIGFRNPLLFGHFIEHFYRQVYGGIYDPSSKLADRDGFRSDVIDALKRISPSVIRWPGGCFASGYHWQEGVGERVPFYDTAWRIEESNAFGTDEFIAFCRKVGTEPYICANAGTGSPEEMGNWVEYCNLPVAGRWARLRRENGFSEPYGVKYWSIGNENYGEWEIGAKEPDEWARFVRESAKMMKRVDPSIQILAASKLDLDWNYHLLKQAGHMINWLSVHGYWAEGDTPYDLCMARSGSPDQIITQMEYILGALGFLGRIPIAFDEWNLRMWHIPGFHDIPPHEVNGSSLAANEDNSTYTMADALFCARFLNACFRHCNTVKMANFAPVVNTRGAIYTHEKGIVLRPSYHVFDMYANYTGDTVIDAYVKTPEFTVKEQAGWDVTVPYMDAVVTHDEGSKRLSIIVSNLHRDHSIEVEICFFNREIESVAPVKVITGETADSYNDIGNAAVGITTGGAPFSPEIPIFHCSPHSISLIQLQLK